MRTPSRLHIALIDMHGGLGRVDGGIGLALEEPKFEISFERADKVIGLKGETKQLAEDVCSKLGCKGVSVDVKESIPEHVGFGSKTQLSLSLASGICKVYDIYKPMRDLAALVGRGGTSGIGVAAFEGGGFILDGGHPSEKGFAPSRFSDASPAPVLARYDFPWWVVCAWPDGKGAHGEIEKNVFEKNCPISASEVGAVSRVILMKMLPALVEKDLGAFGEGINLLQNIGFKKIEIGIKEEVEPLIDFLQKNSAGGGMSSFGPVCFGLCESSSEAKSLENMIRTELGLNTVVSKANNEGAIWL